MIKEGADVGSINDLIHWSEGDLYMCFLPYMYEIKAVSSISVTLTFLEQ